MYSNKKLYFFFCFIFIFSYANSHESVAYINLDRVFNDSLTGKQIITKLNSINEKNIKEINLEEKNWKKRKKNYLKKKIFFHKKFLIQILKN